MTNEPMNPQPSPEEDPGQSTGTTATLPPVPPTAPAPVVRHRRAGRPAIFFGIIAAVFAALFVALLGFLIVAIAAVAAVASGEVDFDGDRVEVDLTPEMVSELPASIVEDNGEIRIDLTELDTAGFAATDGPVELDIRADYGSITVIVPEDIEVSVDADVDLGDVTVFGRSEDGFANSIDRSNADADVALDLDLDVGKIEVVRG